MPIKSYPHPHKRQPLTCPAPAKFIGTLFGIAATSTVTQIAQAEDETVLPDVKVESSAAPAARWRLSEQLAVAGTEVGRLGLFGPVTVAVRV